MKKEKQDMPADKDDRPTRKCTRAEFRAAAVLAGWRGDVIDLFLNPKAPVRKPVPCGKEFLEVTDW